MGRRREPSSGAGSAVDTTSSIGERVTYPDRRVRHGVLGHRGRRLRRPGRLRHERRHDVAPRPTTRCGARRCAARAASAAVAPPVPWRGDRRGGLRWPPARWSRATSLPRTWSWACRRGTCATSATRTCSSAGADGDGRRRYGSGMSSDQGMTSGDPLQPGSGDPLSPPPADQPRHESGLPGFSSDYSSPPPPGAVGGSWASSPAVPSSGQYALAGWWSRVGAALIDGLILFVGWIAIMAVFGAVFWSASSPRRRPAPRRWSSG